MTIQPMLIETANLLISIIIPCYNAARWIRPTLQSVFIQRNVNFEVIVVDDGSSDDSAAIVADDFPLVQLIRVPNGGPGRARNVGLKHSCGTWIQFLDADDLLHPRKLAIQLAVATQCASDVAVVYSDWQRLIYREEKWQQSGVRCQPDPHIDALEDILLTENFIATGSQLFRRTWLEAVCGFDERHWLIEDVDLLLRIAIAGGRFHYVPSEEPLFFYRQHASSLSRRDQRAFIEGCVRNARMVERYWHSKQALTILQINVLTNIYFQATRHFAGYDWTAFEAMMQQIEQLNPQFLPPAPRMLRMMSRVVGYRRAEKLAWRYRHIKANVNALLGKSSA
jgi:glycosyltransferase involved in cell wall biosynthesis